MGERYWISGVQLGLLKALGQVSDNGALSVIATIEEEQFVGNTGQWDHKVCPECGAGQIWLRRLKGGWGCHDCGHWWRDAETKADDSGGRI